jgi:hypothetical protein
MFAIQRGKEVRDVSDFLEDVRSLSMQGGVYFRGRRVPCDSLYPRIAETIPLWGQLSGLRCARSKDADLDVQELRCWKLCGPARPGLILDLERLAVNARTLLPGPEGLAKGIWQAEVIRCPSTQEEGA